MGGIDTVQTGFLPFDIIYCRQQQALSQYEAKNAYKSEAKAFHQQGQALNDIANLFYYVLRSNTKRKCNCKIAREIKKTRLISLNSKYGKILSRYVRQSAVVIKFREHYIQMKNSCLVEY